MKDEELRETERFLKTFALKPGPPGLRGRILAAAAHERETALTMMPLRIAMIGSALLILAILGADTVLSKILERRLDAVFTRPPMVEAVPGEDRSWIMEIFGDARGIEILRREKPLALSGDRLEIIRRQRRNVLENTEGVGHEKNSADSL